MQKLRNIGKQIPTFLTAFIFAFVVWILAVTANDPSIQKEYPSTIPVEVVGQAADLVVTNDLPESLSLVLRAPTSVWTTMIDEKAPVRAVVDLSGLGEGKHNVPIQIEIGVKPVEIVSFSPRSVDVTLEKLATAKFNITVVNNGSPAIGFQLNTQEVNFTEATVSGATSLITRVSEIRAEVDLANVKSDIAEEVTLKAYDQFGVQIKDVSISPEKVEVNETIVQLGGFRNVVVKVVTTGQVAMGYRLTSISVNPPTVTVFSNNPDLIDALPGYIETSPINLNGLKDNLTQDVTLRLGEGISVVGDSTVNVQVSVVTVENSLSLSNVLVQPTGLSSNYTATISPSSVDVTIVGPLVSLNSVISQDLRVLIDLSGMQPGTYTLEPKASLNNPDLRIEYILPKTFEVTIQQATATPKK